MSQTSILVPTLTAARQAIGNGYVGLSLDTLRDEGVTTLGREISDPKRDMDDRFNAALALSERDLNQDGGVGALWLRKFLTFIEITTRGSGQNGQPLYTLQEKHTGVLAAIAIRSTVFNSHGLLASMVKHLEIGISAMERLAAFEACRGMAERQGIAADSKEEAAHHRYLSPKARVVCHTRVDWAHRAMIVLAGQPQDPTALNPVVRMLADALLYKRVDESFKILAVNVLSGRDDEVFGSLIPSLVLQRDMSEQLRRYLFQVLSVYSPCNETYRAFVRQLVDRLKDFEKRQALAGDFEEERAAHEFRSSLERALSPKYTQDQAAAARKAIGTDPWRVLLHLKSFESVIVPRANGNFTEIAPPGTNGDLITRKNIRVR
jgi:hypothetical protein